MDLCGPMRTESINGKKYVLVIVDDYTRFGWVRFLRSKDETPQVIEKFIVKTQRALNATVRFVRTDNGTEFVNKTLDGWFESVGISHETSVPRSPQQNGVVERRNRTLMEAARTMLIFAKAPLFLWAEAVATACYTLNRSLVHTLHGKTYYELLKGKKPNLQYFRVFGSLCYPTNDYDDVGKLKAKADIGIFVGYAPTKKAYRIYNKRTRKIQETVHVAFDELTEGLTSVQTSSGLAPQQMTSVPNSTELELTALQSGRSRSELVKDPEPPSVPPTKKQVDDLFQWFDDDEVIPPPAVPIPPVNAHAAQAPENANGSPSTTVISEGAPAVTESLLPNQLPLPDTSDFDVETLFDCHTPKRGLDGIRVRGREEVEICGEGSAEPRAVGVLMAGVGWQRRLDVSCGEEDGGGCRLVLGHEVASRRGGDGDKVSWFGGCHRGMTENLAGKSGSGEKGVAGMYHNKTVDYVYLLWEDLVYQVKNKNSKKNNDMYYPRFTKVIVDYFMAKDQAYKENRCYLALCRDDSMFTTIRVISKHQDTQIYGAILPQHLTNQAMLESEAYMTYHAYATGEKTPKPKSTKKKADSESSPKTKLTQHLQEKRIKPYATGDKPCQKKQLNKVKRFNSAYLSADERNLYYIRVPDVPTYNLKMSKSSWKSVKEVDKDDEEDDADNQDE
ncbi:retrovirus-related pol polyprotein from transposon TNT 1-94 [Tanacetum coccineum]